MSRNRSICKYHYQKEWVAANPDKVARYAENRRRAATRRKAARGGARGVAFSPALVECSYRAVHQKVAAWRGCASFHTCPCGERAQEWAYNHAGGENERTGTRVTLLGGKRYVTEATWSLDINDYDALCFECHRLRDDRLAVAS